MSASSSMTQRRQRHGDDTTAMIVASTESAMVPQRRTQAPAKSLTSKKEKKKKEHALTVRRSKRFRSFVQGIPCAFSPTSRTPSTACKKQHEKKVKMPFLLAAQEGNHSRRQTLSLPTNAYNDEALPSVNSLGSHPHGHSSRRWTICPEPEKPILSELRIGSHSKAGREDHSSSKPADQLFQRPGSCVECSDTKIPFDNSECRMENHLSRVSLLKNGPDSSDRRRTDCSEANLASCSNSGPTNWLDRQALAGTSGQPCPFEDSKDGIVLKTQVELRSTEVDLPTGGSGQAWSRQCSQRGMACDSASMPPLPLEDTKDGILVAKPDFEAEWGGSWWDVSIMAICGGTCKVRYNGFADTEIDTIPLNRIRLAARAAEDSDCPKFAKKQNVVIFTEHPEAHEGAQGKAWYDGQIISISRKGHKDGVCKCEFHIQLHSIVPREGRSGTSPRLSKEKVVLKGIQELTIPQAPCTVSLERIIRANCSGNLWSIPRCPLGHAGGIFHDSFTCDAVSLCDRHWSKNGLIQDEVRGTSLAGVLKQRGGVKGSGLPGGVIQGDSKAVGLAGGLIQGDSKGVGLAGGLIQGDLKGAGLAGGVVRANLNGAAGQSDHPCAQLACIDTANPHEQERTLFNTLEHDGAQRKRKLGGEVEVKVEVKTEEEEEGEREVGAASGGGGAERGSVRTGQGSCAEECQPLQETQGGQKKARKTRVRKHSVMQFLEKKQSRVGRSLKMSLLSCGCLIQRR